MGRPRSKNGPKIGFFESVRDVLIASMNKGQFPAALLAMVVLSMIWRMPPTDVSKLVFRLLDVAEEKKLLGYFVSVFSLLGWFFHAKYQRKLITFEMQRVSSERNQLQAKELGKKLKSSEARK